MQYICDDKRHLVCLPYSIENLHIMAKDLKLGSWWFDKDHYDLPVGRIDEIAAKCTVVDTKTIIKIIKQQVCSLESQEGSKVVSPL